MRTESRPRTDELFAEGLAVPAARRDAFLAERCGGDAALRSEVRSLLEAADRAGEFLIRPAGDFATEDADDFRLPAGTCLGPYRVERLLAVGGMAAVHEAVRADGQFEQRVAIKVIRRDLASRSLVRRFERERRVLAGLEHPNIARLLDGGTTADGLPYFVMEFVDGEPIDAWCARRLPGPRERMSLFLRVCRAVEYAHQHLLIHRDLKPNNILVAADGTPKLLDFGVARLLTPAEGDAPPTIGYSLLTPRYASPEQLAGAASTTAGDVYSLGVILGELLDGSAGAATPRGDLRLILERAAAPRPEDRYPSVEQFSGDLGRFLRGEPISIRRPTLRYRIARFAARNRITVGLAAAAVIALAAGIVSTSLAMLDARRAAADARRERFAAVQAGARESRVSSFLEETIRLANPYRQRGRLTMLDLLDECAVRVNEAFSDDPLAAARIHMTLGEAYANLWRWPDAEIQADLAVALRRRHGPPDDPSIADALLLLGRALTFKRDPAAVAMQREVLSRRTALYGDRHPATAEARTALAFALWYAARNPQMGLAESLYRGALNTYDGTLSGPDRRRAMAHFSFANLLMRTGRAREALVNFDAALSEWSAAALHEDYYSFHCRLGRAHALREIGRLPAACEAMAAALQSLPAGVDDDQARISFETLASWYDRLGMTDLAQQARRDLARLNPGPAERP